MKVPNPQDPRALRTRQALREALVSLIIERGWDAIGIRDVCQRAGIGRSTFYTHFADREELLLAGYDDLRKMLRRASAAEGRWRALAFTLPLLEHAEENKRMFRALVGRRSSEMAKSGLLRLIIELTREDLAPLGEATAQYVAGAFFQLLVWWVDSRSQLGPGDIDALFRRLTAPVLATGPSDEAALSHRGNTPRPSSGGLPPSPRGARPASQGPPRPLLRRLRPQRSGASPRRPRLS
jgi:AcrR family transcriptional regulator